MKAKRKRKSDNQAGGTIEAPEPRLGIDAAAEKVLAVAAAEASRHGLDVLLVVSNERAEWRAKWGSAPIDRVWYLVRRVVLAVERMIP